MRAMAKAMRVAGDKEGEGFMAMATVCVCVCPGLRLRGFKLYSMRFQLLTLAPLGIHSIPWDSVVLPFGTPVDDSHGGMLKGVPMRPCILVIMAMVTRMVDERPRRQQRGQWR
jgi:hypothetical protein